MSKIEVNKIIDPTPASDGAGVKLKRSIGVEPNYFDPFLMLDEFGSENSEDYIAGFPPHPHRGIETVTYMLAGDFEHKDSTGGEGRMTAGDVQWMKTGSGIIHSEMPAMKEGNLHGFQLWINMPATMKMDKPEYHYIHADKMSVHKDNDKQIKVIAGKFQKAEGPIKKYNIKKNEVAFLSANTWDISGGGNYGYNSIWVNRNNNTFDNLDYVPKHQIKDLSKLLDII